MKSRYLSALVALSVLSIAGQSNATWERFTDLNVTGQVYAMLDVGDDLYIGGSFDTTVNGERLAHIARRSKDGVWHSVGAGVNGAVWALANDQGTIVVGGEFDSVYGGFEGGTLAAGDIARWTGKFWDVLNGGFHEHYQGVHAIAVTPTGLYAGGDFETTTHGDSVHNIARYDGTQWNAVGGGIQRWRGALPVWKIAPWKNGIAVAGYFMGAGGHPGSGIALWDGAEWTTLYSQSDEVHTEDVISFNGSIAYSGTFGLVHPGLPAFVSYDGHSTFAIPSPGITDTRLALLGGQVVIATGPGGTVEDSYHNLALFNAGVWEEIGGGLSGPAITMSTNAAGSELLIAGYFISAGGLPTNGMAIWRPEASVHSVTPAEFVIFPNPAIDRVIVPSGQIQVMNALGQKVSIEATTRGDKQELIVSSLSPGPYYVVTASGSYSFIKK